MPRAPTQAGLPPLSLMLADIPADLDKIALHLGISPRTLTRYAAADQAPRCIMLALFWETQWGQSLAHTTAHNYGNVHRARAAGLEREKAALLAQIRAMERLLADAAGVASNAPFFQPGRVTCAF